MWRMDVQRQRYGAHLYIKDEEGCYVCFFKGCGQKYKANFSRHIEGHENKHDPIDEEFAALQAQKYKEHPELTTPATGKNRFRMSRRKTVVPLKNMKKILDNIKSRPQAFAFLEPVDPVKSGATDYYSIIETPMDLRTVSEKLNSSIADPTNGPYKSTDDFAADVKLVFTNARKYNAPGSPLYNSAGEMARIFDSKMEAARIAAQNQQTDAGFQSKFAGIELTPSQLVQILETVSGDPLAWPFLEPVDPDRYELPDYLKIIKEPMDLSTVWNNMQAGKYSRSFMAFLRDMRLIFRNAMVYNEAGCDIYEYAEHLSAVFEAEVENMLHVQAKLAKSLETLYCLRESNTKRVLFYDMEKGQYYLEYFETEDEQVINELDKKESAPPPAKRRKMGDNPDPSVMAELAKHERTYARKDPAVLARVNELVWALYRPRQSNVRTVGGERKRRAAAMVGMRNMNIDIDESPAPANRRKRARPAPTPVPKKDSVAIAISEPGTPFDAPATPITPGAGGAYSYPQSGAQTPATSYNATGTDEAFTPRPATPFTPASGYDEDEYVSISPRAEQSGASTPAPAAQPQTPTPYHTPAEPQTPYQPTTVTQPSYLASQPTPSQTAEEEVDPFPQAQSTSSMYFDSSPAAAAPPVSTAPTPEAPRQPIRISLGNLKSSAGPKPNSGRMDWN